MDGGPQVPQLFEVAGVELRQQVLERLSHPEQAHVGPGRRGQVAAQDVAGVGPDGGPVGGLGPAGKLLVPPGLGIRDRGAGPGVPQLGLLQRKRLAHVLDHRLHLPRIGAEQEIHELAVVLRVLRLGDGRLHEVEVLARGVLAVEADVTGGLLQRRDADARVLQVLGRDVGDLFAGHVGAAQLRHRVVAVPDEHALVEGPRPLHRGVVPVRRSGGAEHRGEVGVAQELVQERAPEVPGRAAVAGEERPGHLLRQVQAEDRPVHVAEERGEPLAFRGSEVFHGDETGAARPGGLRGRLRNLCYYQRTV